MDEDRIKGAVREAVGAMKQAVGKVFGDARLQAEGMAEKHIGKAENAAGGLKDAARDAVNE